MITAFVLVDTFLTGPLGRATHILQPLTKLNLPWTLYTKPRENACILHILALHLQFYMTVSVCVHGCVYIRILSQWCLSTLGTWWWVYGRQCCTPHWLEMQCGQKAAKQVEMYMWASGKQVLLRTKFTWRATVVTISTRNLRAMLPNFRASIVLKENLSGILKVSTKPLLLVGKAAICAYY